MTCPQPLPAGHRACVGFIIGKVDDTQLLADVLEQLLPIGGWVRDAACRGQGDLFTSYPASGAASARVTQLCSRCPVRVSCETHAVEHAEADAVWAGAWRTRNRRAAPRSTAPLAGCGTNAGWARHNRRGETVCEGCRVAHLDYGRLRREARAG